MKPFLKHGSLTQIIYGQNKFDLDVLNSKIPSANRTDKRLESNIFTVFDIFQSERQSNDDLKILGLINGKRVYRYVNREFIDLDHPNLNKYKVLLPVSNGSGALGEVISTPLIGEPLIGYTRTFIGIGAFDNEVEAEAALKYIKCKFTRAMLGVKKVTQHNPKSTWEYVPLQDFTPNSDIDWTKSIPEIDQQLYKKYNLSEEEINFIETKVQAMD